MMGPEPMIRTDLMELSLGIVKRGAFWGAKIPKKSDNKIAGFHKEKGLCIMHNPLYIIHQNGKGLIAVVVGGNFVFIQLHFDRFLLGLSFHQALVKRIIGMNIIKSVVPDRIVSLTMKNSPQPVGKHGCPFFDCVNDPFHNPQIF
jgi:hypothetical protein